MHNLLQNMQALSEVYASEEFLLEGLKCTCSSVAHTLNDMSEDLMHCTMQTHQMTCTGQVSVCKHPDTADNMP